LGGGLGWLFSSSGQAADINIPGVTFFIAFQKPHQTVAVSLYLVSLVFLFLSFLPWGWGRLFLNGLLFPLVLIELLWLKKISVQSKNYQLNSWLIILFLLIFTPFSSFYIFKQRVKEASKSNVWFYLPLEIKKGFDFLETERKRVF
jgi:hypothetical protein